MPEHETEPKRPNHNNSPVAHHQPTQPKSKLVGAPLYDKPFGSGPTSNAPKEMQGSDVDSAKPSSSTFHFAAGDSATEALEERYDAFDASWQRAQESHADPRGGELVGGGRQKATELDHHHPGDAGYAARLGNAGSHAAEAALAKGNYRIPAPPVQPHTEAIDRAIGIQTEWIAAKSTATEAQRYDMGKAAKTLGFGQIGKDPDWVTKHKSKSLARAEAQVAMLERHRFEQFYWVNSYNSWAPIANEVQTARADLIETAAMMGFDLGKPTDIARFVQGIEQGLDRATALVDAKVLGPKHQTSWSGRADDKGKASQGPQMDGEAISSEFEHLQNDYNAVTVAQMDVYRLLLQARTAELENSKDAKESKVNEINGVIQFWTDIAKIYESGVGGFGAKVGGVEGKINQYAGQSRVRRHERQAVADAKAGNHAEAGTNIELADVARETSAPEGRASGGLQMPSFSGMVEFLVTHSMQGELTQLKGQIDMLSRHIKAQKAIDSMAAAKAIIDKYADARATLTKTAQRVKRTSLAKREVQYLQTGDALDRYARQNVAALKAKGLGNLAPKDDKHEVYSHLMLIVAKIRAYMLVSDTARNMFSYDKFVTTAVTLSKVRRSANESPELQGAPAHSQWLPPRIAAMTSVEDKQVWEAIDGSYATVFDYAERAKIQFGPIEDKVTGLLQKMKGVEAKNGDAPENEY